MEELHLYLRCDVGSRSRMANAMLEEHNKPARIHAPTGAMDHLTLMDEA
jgi:hypothetical protein